MEYLTPNTLSKGICKMTINYTMYEVTQMNSCNVYLKENAENPNDFQYGAMKDDVFTPADITHLAYFYGYGSTEVALRSFYRKSVSILRRYVDKVLDLDSSTSRNFVNGGTYSNGYFVEELIVYVPGYSKHDNKVHEGQKIFTYCSELVDFPESITLTPSIKMFENETRYVGGMMLQEDSHPKFHNVLASVPVQTINKHHLKTVFPEFAELSDEAFESVVGVDVDMKNWLQHIELTAELIKKYYFDGLTYSEYRKREEAKIVEVANHA